MVYLVEKRLQQICEGLENVRKGQIKRFSLTDDHLEQIIQTCCVNDGLDTLSCSYNDFGIHSEALNRFVKGLAHSTISSLAIVHNDLTLASCQAMTPLFENTRITRVSLAHNPMSLEMLAQVIDQVNAAPHIEHLDLSHCYLGNQGLIYFAKHCRALKSVALDGVISVDCESLSSQALEALSEWLGNTQQLEHLSLAHNRLNDADCLQLIPDISALTKLKSLSLRGDPVEGALFKQWSAGESSATSLLHLDCGKGVLEVNQLQLLQAWLETLPQLQTLNLSHNPFGDQGCYGLIETFKHLKLIKTLVLEHNRISCDGFIALCRFFQENPSVRHCRIALNELTDRATIPTYNFIVHNVVLQKLHLTCRKMPADLAAHLIAALKFNPSLIDFKCEPLSQHQQTQCRKLVKRNQDILREDPDPVGRRPMIRNVYNRRQRAGIPTDIRFDIWQNALNRTEETL